MLFRSLPLSTNNQIDYKQGGKQILILENTGATAVTVVIKGAQATTVILPRLGETKNVASGFSVVLAPTSRQHLALINISEYLKGAITVTGGTAATTAIIIEA